MECPSCQRENRPGAAFCDGCGTRLALACASCGHELRPDARFCDGCGARTGTPQAGPPPDPPRPGVGPAGGAPRAFAAGRYQLDGLIGEGARKRVYRARDARLGREVALAVIKTDGLDEDGRARVRREAQAMARLGDHPHVVTVYDIGEEDGDVFLVSQLMSGDLDTRLGAAPNRRLPIDDVLRLAGEIASGLVHAHDAGIVHRDLKPGNVFLNDDGRAALADFGLAVATDQSRFTQEGMMVGTVAYMAPEQALGRSADARSDLYGLGATLYELVTGRPPFPGDDAVAIISQHMHTPPVAPSWHREDVPHPLDQLILRLLEKVPEDRPKSAAEVVEQVARIAQAASGVEPVPEPAQNPLDSLSQGVFVGREEELARVRSRLDEVFSGRGRVLLLVGEPGIGKTRTSEEITTYANLRGARVLWGRCYEGEGAPAYWPWVQLVRAYVRERDPATLLAEFGAGANAIADVVSEVRERIPGLQPAPPLEPAEARFRLFDSVTSFLKNAARAQPLVLVLDDLHWADKPSLLLLQYLAQELGSARILVLGTYRDVELRRTHPLAETLADLVRVEGTERVLLRGLAEEDVARFLELSAGRKPPPALARAVYQETEGNPFFVHEVVRLLVAEGRLERAQDVGSWSVTSPQGIREVIGRRLNRLSEDCNELLRIASVVGREFDVAVLEHVADMAEPVVSKALDEAVAARLINESSESVGRYRFSHALVRETLYEELSTTRRVRLHRRVAEVLETHYGARIQPHLAELSYHAVEGAHGGGDVERAIDYARRAGERAAELGAYEEAAPHYERALQALELRAGDAPEERCDLLIALSEASWLSGDRARAADVARSAVELARVLADPRRLARGAAALSRVVFALGVPTPEPVALLEEALARLGDEVCAERVEALCRLSNELNLGPTHPRSEQLAERAVEVARDLGDPETLLVALQARSQSLSAPDGFELRDAVCAEARAIADGAGILTMQGWARWVAMMQAFQRGDGTAFARAAEELGQFTGLSPVGRFWLALAEATLALLRADWDRALTLVHAAFDKGRNIFGSGALQMFGVQMSAIQRARGEIDVGAFEQIALRFPQPAWHAAVAMVYSEAGRHDEARARLRKFCADDLAAIPWDGNWPAAVGNLAEACANVGDEQSAALLYARLLPQAGRIIAQGASAYLGGATCHHLGRLAALLGRPDEAAAHFEAALAITESLGARDWLARTQLAYARFRMERGAPGDRDAALELTNAALAFARETDTPTTLEAALALKLELQGVERSSTQGSIHTVTATVHARPLDLSSHSAPDGTVTLMFSDMEGFTSMTERLGDLQAREVIRAHNRIVREQLVAHGGHEVELQGDGFLLAFGSARRGLQCAVALQRAFDAYNADAPEPIRVRIGLHTGEALRDADKFFGKTVILASRIAAQAQGGEILVSALLRDLAASSGEFTFAGERSLPLKGISEPQRVCDVIWDA